MQQLYTECVNLCTIFSKNLCFVSEFNNLFQVHRKIRTCRCYQLRDLNLQPPSPPLPQWSMEMPSLHTCWYSASLSLSHTLACYPITETELFQQLGFLKFIRKEWCCVCIATTMHSKQLLAAMWWLFPVGESILVRAGPPHQKVWAERVEATGAMMHQVCTWETVFQMKPIALCCMRMCVCVCVCLCVCVHACTCVHVCVFGAIFLGGCGDVVMDDWSTGSYVA